MLKLKKGKTFIKTLALTLTLLAIKSHCYATESTSIGTAEVTAATENIKRVITSIAMPLRWCTYFCKCCCSSSKNDC